MGVQGLWQLLQPVARPIKLESLEGKRLAIDSSIWLYHFQMAMRDKEGRTLSNAHILGFLWRILKLLFHGVRPVFVFDGGAPVMKRRTLTNRKARRQGAKESHARTAEKLLAAQLRQAAIKHVAEGRTEPDQPPDTGLAENTVYFDDLQQGQPSAIAPVDLRSGDGRSSALTSSSRDISRNSSPDKAGSPSKPKKPDWHKDPYALPALEKELHTLSAQNGKKGKRADYRFATEGELRAVMSTIAPEDLDTESELFRSLPPELQYELVGDLRAQSRMTSYKRLQSMLATAPTPIDFSRAQIAGLKTRNDLTQKVLTVTDEIGSANIKVPLRVAGERNKEYVLVRNPGAEGGFVLGVRDSGVSAEKAIEVDDERERAETTDEDLGLTDPEIELELDEVEIPSVQTGIPPSAQADSEVAALRGESDPIKRKAKAMEILQKRAKQHARQARKDAGLDVIDVDAPPRHRKPDDTPLFIRDGGPAGSNLIDMAAEDDDDDDDDSSTLLDANDELDADEAEDLSKALYESARDRPSVKPRQLYGFGLSSRGGEPVSLHHAMRASSSPSASSGPSAPVPAALLPEVGTVAGSKSTSMSRSQPEPIQVSEDDLEDIEFEDVDVPAAGTAPPSSPGTAIRPPQRKSQVRGSPISPSASSVAAKVSKPAGDSDRMKELAALVNRSKKAESDAAAPPRKSLAGSLRTIHPTFSPNLGHFRGDSLALNSTHREVVSVISERDKEVAAAHATALSPERKGLMGPPARSASQTKLEMTASPCKATTVPSLRSERGPQRDAGPKLVAKNALELSEGSPAKPEEAASSAAVNDDSGSAMADETNTIAAKAGIDDIVVEETQHSEGSAIDSVLGAPHSAAMDSEPPIADSPPEVTSEMPLASPANSPGAGRRVRQQEPVSKHRVSEPIVITSSPASVEEARLADGDEEAGEEESTSPHDIVVHHAPTAVDGATQLAGPAVATSRASSREGTPIQWSPSPSPEPVVLGADGFPLPTAEELEAMDAEDEEEIARLNADQNEFAAFLSASKGRSLLDVQQEVENEVNALRAEHANSRKSEEDITRQMAQEIQMMLRLFGLPYITAPMEAEAQCAELVSRRLVDGIITDDSDVFLFGGTRIYKNMFNNNKIVECFLLSDLQRELGLDREKLVRLAYFLGSDYTEGLAGVGPVLAMELLALFPGQDGLLKFGEWWRKVQMGQDTPQDTRGKTMRRIKKALRNKVHLAPSWPEPEVLDAYYQPSVDESEEAFQWGLPDLDSLRTFLGEYLHWPITKTDQYLLPIIEKQNQRSRARGNQSTLDRGGFFDTSAGLGVYAGRKKPTYGSNRLQEVINGFRAATKSKCSNGEAGQSTATQRPRRRRRHHGAAAGAISSSSNDSDSTSTSSDGVEMVETNAQPHVPEELLGKEMGKRRPVVRRSDVPPASTTSADRAAELDAAVEALEGQRPDSIDGSSNTKARRAPSKQARRGVKRGKNNDNAQQGGAAAVGTSVSNSEDVASDQSSSSADEWRPMAKRGRGRGRGRGQTASTAAARGSTHPATRARGRGRGRGGARANLHAARNMSLDDVHRLPESRSPSLPPGRLSRRSSSNSSSVTTPR